ncbi:hypothetical protein [Candidatus Hodarchaeum mangrovi]
MIVDQICEKIKPFITIEFQSGRFKVTDFRELLKRIDLTPHERKYLSANFRLVVTKLGLFHYLPEIQKNEDIALFQLIEVVTEDWISHGIVKSRTEAVNRLIEQIKTRLKDRSTTVLTISEGGDIRILIQSLRENITNFWDKNPERVPDLIDEFRDALSETSQSSRLLYDVMSYSRDIRSKKIKYLEDVLEEIDAWEKRLFLDK